MGQRDMKTKGHGGRLDLILRDLTSSHVTVFIKVILCVSAILPTLIAF